MPKAFSYTCHLGGGTDSRSSRHDRLLTAGKLVVQRPLSDIHSTDTECDRRIRPGLCEQVRKSDDSRSFGRCRSSGHHDYHITRAVCPYTYRTSDHRYSFGHKLRTDFQPGIVSGPVTSRPERKDIVREEKDTRSNPRQKRICRVLSWRSQENQTYVRYSPGNSFRNRRG